jgi:hypothetical protein
MWDILFYCPPNKCATDVSCPGDCIPFKSTIPITELCKIDRNQKLLALRQTQQTISFVCSNLNPPQ